MSTVKVAYSATNVAITCTLASLSNGNARASTAVDNTSNLYTEALVVVAVKSAGSSTSSTGHVDVYVYGSADNGSTYPEGITGSDAALTLVSPTNLFPLRSINVVANSTTYESEPMPVSAAFGGTIPDHWGIVVVNNSGASLDSTEGNHKKIFAGINYTIA